jgi:phasin family protein
MAKQPQSESVVDMFARLGRELHMPEVDIDRVIEHHRRNLEAFERSAKAASAGASSLFARQREMLQETLDDINDMAAHLRAGGDPQELVARQADLARKGFEAAVRNTGEVADIVARSSSDALDILRKRIKEGLEEIRQGVEKRR